MKKILLVLLLAVSYNAFGQAPSPTSPNTLFLKYKLSINGEYSFGKCLILKADETDKEWKEIYGFLLTDSKGSAINTGFYIPDETRFWYVNPATYAAVAKDNNQLRDILDFPMRHPDRTNYIKGFSKIYVLDLEQPNPSNPSMYKLIEVKPYFPWEH